MKEKEENLLKSRILELARNTYFKEINTNTLFLNLYEQTVFCTLCKNLPKVNYTLYGGYEAAERKIVCFFPCSEKEYSSPIEILKIEILGEKFSSKISHRDFLGAILNIGIDRANIGDILPRENFAYVFVLKRISKVILEELSFVRKNPVRVRKVDFLELENLDNTKIENVNVASLRLDALIAASQNKSRTLASELIKSKLVFVNSKECTNGAYTVKENDLITIRKVARFKFLDVVKETRKERLVVRISRYI